MVDQRWWASSRHSCPLDRGRLTQQFGQSSQVLCGRCQQAFVSGTAHPSQSQPIQIQGALEVRYYEAAQTTFGQRFMSAFMMLPVEQQL